jgi:hypothetical protein
MRAWLPRTRVRVDTHDVDTSRKDLARGRDGRHVDSRRTSGGKRKRFKALR